MNIKTIASAAVLTAALGFTGAAYAQSMIGNAQVSEADMERVKTYCADLQADADAAAGTTQTDSTETNSETATTEAQPDQDNESMLGSVPVDQVTLETCLEAGFIEAAAE